MGEGNGIVQIDSDDLDERCAKWMFQQIQLKWPSTKKPDFKKWAAIVRRIREYDLNADGTKKTHRQIADLFQWANNHEFWWKNIRSPDKFRQQYERLEIERADSINRARRKPQRGDHTSIERSDIDAALSVGRGNSQHRS